MKTDNSDSNSNNTEIKPVGARQHVHAKPQSRFQKLWNEAESLKHINLELETSLDQLVQRVRSDVGPIEMEMGQTMRRQIDKLIVFAGRRSLAQWQMQVLDEWIMSTMEILQPLGLVDDALTDSLAKLQAQVFGIEIDAESDLSAAEQLAMAMDAQLSGIDIQLDDDDTLDSDGIDEVMQWLDEELLQSDFAEQHGEQFGWQDTPRDNESDTTNSGSAPSESIFKTLFHRVARALHPDKEIDIKKREIKQALMAQLLEARRNKDLMQVFKLYQEHVADTSNFGEQELMELESVLRDFIARERERQTEIITKSYVHEAVFREFYSKNPAKVDRAIRQKIKQIERRKKDIETFSKTVTSLQKLKPYLEARYDLLPRYF